MVVVAFAVLLAGYSLIYIGVEKIRGDHRTVTDMFMGRSL